LRESASTSRAAALKGRLVLVGGWKPPLLEVWQRCDACDIRHLVIPSSFVICHLSFVFAIRHSDFFILIP